MRVAIFKSVRASWPQETELDDIVRVMRSSQKTIIWTQTCRQYMAKGDKMGAENVKITCFPAFAPCAIFYDGKSTDNVMGLTDLCYLDIDHIKNESLINEAMDTLSKDPYVLMASRSVSNKGLHILIRYHLDGYDEPPQRTTMAPKEMQDLYGEVYDHLSVKYQLILGLECDYHARHMEHLYIVSYDPNLYYNPNAESLLVDLNEPIIDMSGKPTQRSLECKIQEAERLICKCNLDEAEKILCECYQWIIDISSNDVESPKQDYLSTQRRLENYLSKLRNVIEIKTKVDKMIKEVDEDMRNHEVKDAHAKIRECQWMLKKTTGPFNNAIKKIRNGVVNKERKLAALNRELRREAREKKCGKN